MPGNTVFALVVFVICTVFLEEAVDIILQGVVRVQERNNGSGEEFIAALNEKKVTFCLVRAFVIVLAADDLQSVMRQLH